MTAFLCPVFQEPQLSDNDEFLASGLLWFYEAGSSTLATAYTTETGDVAWPNPIVLDSRGESGGTIWLNAGQAYRIVLEGKPAYGQTHGAVITEHDNITGINDPSVGATDGNWILFAGEPTYLSATSFSVLGDYRDIFAERRRLYSNNAGGVVYSSISSSSYAAGVTTVNVTNDSGTLDVGLSSVYYSFSLPIALPIIYDDMTVTDLTVTNVNGNLASHLLFGTKDETSPGYLKLDSGLIIQWGSGTTDSGTNQLNVTLPQAYASNIWYIGVTAISSSTFYSATAVKTSNSEIKITTFANGTIDGDIPVYWMTIGK